MLLWGSQVNKKDKCEKEELKIRSRFVRPRTNINICFSENRKIWKYLSDYVQKEYKKVLKPKSGPAGQEIPRISSWQH